MILLIDNYDSFTYNLYQALARFDTVNVVRNDKIKIDDVVRLQPNKIVLSPGPGRPSQAGICSDVIIYCTKHAIPLLGVCLGHQAIVEVFGGKVEVANVPVHGKTTRIFHHGRGIYNELPLPFKAGRYHSLYAPRNFIPDCIIIESENAEGMVMGVRHETMPIYGVQFHPESILTPSGGRLIENFVKQG